MDITSTALWTGPPVGIVRVERQLAGWARRHRRDIRFVLFDPADQCFHCINEAWLDRLLAGDQVSVWNMPHPLSSRSGRMLARGLQALKLRRNLVLLLDRIRRSTSATASSRAVRLQSLVASPRYRERMFDRHGQRRALVSYRSLLGPAVAFGPDDTLVLAGSGWSNVNIQAVEIEKRRRGFRLVVLCHDLIPPMFPQFYPAEDVRRVDDYFSTALRVADKVIFTAAKVATDAAEFAGRKGFRLPDIACLPLGSDFIAAGEETAPLPHGLQPGRFALFVSTIEPRKGHQLLWRIWQRLLAEGVPQRSRFQLVFVGRAGWMLEDLVAGLRAANGAEQHFLWLESVEDDLLYALYEKAAFCLYPSVYEGYGLPIIEAFAHGKAVLASRGGSIPEVVGALSPCIEAGDEEAWHRTLRSWILEPAARQPFEQRIRTEFRQRSWGEFAEEFLAEATGVAA